MAESRGRQAIGRLRWIQIDTQNPEQLAEFWSGVLGTEIDGSLGDPPQYIDLAPAEPGAPRVSFQRVPEAKLGKNRLHFDLLVADVETASARVVEIGGSRLGTADFKEHGFSWRVMKDPQGNEFCLIYGVETGPPEPSP